MFSTLLPSEHLLRNCFVTPHLFFSLIKSLLCTLNLGLKLSVNAEPTCSTELAADQVIHTRKIQHNLPLIL